MNFLELQKEADDCRNFCFHMKTSNLVGDTNQLFTWILNQPKSFVETLFIQDEYSSIVTSFNGLVKLYGHLSMVSYKERDIKYFTSNSVPKIAIDSPPQKEWYLNTPEIQEYLQPYTYTLDTPINFYSLDTFLIVSEEYQRNKLKRDFFETANKQGMKLATSVYSLQQYFNISWKGEYLDET